MSAKANNVGLDATALAALREAAARHRKTLEQMASEAVIEGLRAERLNLLRERLLKGHHHLKDITTENPAVSGRIACWMSSTRTGRNVAARANRCAPLLTPMYSLVP